MGKRWFLNFCLCTCLPECVYAKQPRRRWVPYPLECLFRATEVPDPTIWWIFTTLLDQRVFLPNERKLYICMYVCLYIYLHVFTVMYVCMSVNVCVTFPPSSTILWYFTYVYIACVLFLVLHPLPQIIERQVDRHIDR